MSKMSDSEDRYTNHQEGYSGTDNLRAKYLVLRITEKCNNNCVFCSDHYKNNDRQMAFDDIKKLVSENKDDDILIEIGGAEPTLHPDFFKIIEFANKNTKLIHLTTNARIFCYKNLADRLPKMRISIKSSLHGHTPAIHDEITQTEGSFDQALEGFRNLAGNNIDIKVNVVINRKNIDHLKKIADLLKDAGVKGIIFSGLILSGNGDIDRRLVVGIDEIKKKLPKVLKYCADHEIYFFIEKLPVCIAPDFSKRFLLESDKSSFIKLEICENCACKDSCMGFSKAFFLKNSKGIERLILK
jgi:MoaA/NifB/PqqE/SkfB family radical SAM enzyme